MTTDKAALEALAKVSDLRQPHTIRHFLYFPAKDDAGLAREALKSLRFDADEDIELTFGSWSVIVTSVVVPSEAEVTRMRGVLDTIARDFNGEYDGWEAKVCDHPQDSSGF